MPKCLTVSNTTRPIGGDNPRTNFLKDKFKAPDKAQVSMNKYDQYEEYTNRIIAYE